MIKIINADSISNKELEKLKGLINELIEENKMMNTQNIKNIKIVEKIENQDSDGRYQNGEIS